MRRGDVVQVDFDPVIGHELAKLRPAVIVQNDVGNRSAPTTIVAAVTAYSAKKAEYPFCVEVPEGQAGLTRRSVVNCAHIWSIDKVRVRRRLGTLSSQILEDVDQALKVSFGLL